MTILLLISSILVALPSYPMAFADAQERLDFAAGLEEALGHFWALELNLDENNAELAETHATHPIAELYDAMKPQLQAADPAFDQRFFNVLSDLKDEATVTVSRAQAQAAIDDAAELVEEARTLVVGDALSNDPHFKIQLIKSLLETSIVEYGVAFEGGSLSNLAELQDGTAFVVRSQEIFDEIKSEIDSDDAANLDAIYNSLNGAYDEQADPSVIESQTNGLIRNLDGVTDKLAQERLDFAAGLEEALGHFWALELNLDENNAELAETHATHPIAELYDAMKPQLQAADPAFDQRFFNVLSDLKDEATVTVSRAQAQAAIDDATELVEEARTLVVGDTLSNDPNFKLLLIKSLLETSIVEYGVAFEGGSLSNLAELQDGTAFVVRSQEIFDEIKSEIDSDDAANLDAIYNSLNGAYDEQADPSVIESQTNGLIRNLDGVTDKLAQERLDFAAGLEEALGHFWALELNLDENNAELAETHATHPIAELYGAMKPQLQAADPAFDQRFFNVLSDLKDEATVTVSRAQAQAAIDDATELVEEARTLVVGDTLSNDPNFKLLLIKSLLETSIVEYGVAFEGGSLSNLAELQDGTAFVIRSQEIFDEIKSDIEDSDDLSRHYKSLNAAYNRQAAPSVVTEETTAIIDIINSITGDDGSAGIQGHIDAIRMLLEDTRSAYSLGDLTTARSSSIKAYLDHYEFLELPLIDAGEREFMVQVENQLRIELRQLITNGAASSTVSGMIDRILTQIDRVEDILTNSSGN
jgi:transaldolase